MNRVLVVFREETQFERLALLLRQAEVHATVARSEESMLAALADPYDAVFAELPKFAASTELAECKAQRIAVAHRNEADELKKALGRVVDDYLFMPLGQDEVRLALQRPRAPRARAEAVQAIVGVQGGLAKPWGIATKAAGFDADVLLAGESGTGKELFARAIHNLSGRSGGAFVPVNCSAIPQGLAESLLFGHVQGAFTGAHTSAKGVFAKAHGGTLFLDEVGDISEQIQVKLLRALQSGEVQPLGAEQAESLDVRVIAATSRDLSAMVGAGTFREDLYYRLAVVPIELPPLRERPQDAGLLIDHFLTFFATHHQADSVAISEEARGLLLQARWPGNVRQLRNAVERLVVLSEDGIIGAGLVQQEIGSLEGDASCGPSISTGLTCRSLREAMRTLEAEFIRQALAECGGKRGDCAKRLSISSRSLLYKLKEYGIQ
ncbi:MAG: sigma-54-dependent Fis family transcriptional regulator [Myxococcales bacterium]|nr:sigma-54-dependent Fis family transcriptional regulator [Myxococcales bacterium]